MQFWCLQVFLVLLDVPSPTATAEPDVYPQRGNGFAAEIVPALFAVAVLALIAVWVSSRPKRRKR